MPEYPLPKFHFQVDWGGTKLGFTEVTGLKVETGVIEYRDGVSPEYHTLKQPAMQKYGNLTFKRGIFKGDNELYEWWNTVALNTIERRDITISLLDENHDPVKAWRVTRAFPISVESTDLNAESEEVAIETMEIAHEGLVMQEV